MKRKRELGRNLLARALGRVFRPSMPSYFVQTAPRASNMVALFAGTWASRLPFEDVGSGSSDLFHDERIRWFLEVVGGVEGRDVLELGPLEGGHSHMLEAGGARRVVAVEANGQSWLKCLAVKETIGLPRTSFLLGDFVKYLQEDGEAFDAALACGILYHLKDPHKLFPLLRARCRGPVMLWTMVWSETIATAHPGLHKRFKEARTATLSDGRTIRLHKHEYKGTYLSKGFFGGNDSYSEWMSRDDLEAAITAAGYRVEQVAFDEPDHPNGPAIGMVIRPV